MTAEIIKLPYSVTRGAHSRKPRRSKNGTPEERAAKLRDPAPVVPLIENRHQDRIEWHRRASAEYDRCVDAGLDTGAAWEALAFAARGLVIDLPTTPDGLANWAKYVGGLLTEYEAANSGSVYLPDEIGGKPWPVVFLRCLPAALRAMRASSDRPVEKPLPADLAEK